MKKENKLTPRTTSQQKEKARFRVSNIDCEHDAAQLRRQLEETEGLAGLDILPKSARVTIDYDPDLLSPKELEKLLDEAGFPVQEDGMPEQPKPWKNPKVVTSVLSGLLLLAGWLLGFAGIPEAVSTGIYWVAILTGGYYFGREALEDLWFEKSIGIELLMSIAAVVAAVMGQPAEGAMLVFLYSISEAAEGYTEEKTRSAVKALMDLAPKTALILRDGHEEEIPVEEVRVGDLFLVKPGQSVPTDGVIREGASSLNEAPVTGESTPVDKSEESQVFAGTINGEGLLKVEATKTTADNTLARIIQMVEEAQERKGKSQRFIERFGSRYSPAVLAAGVLIAIIPPLLFNAGWETWITRATVFIVAAAPCALVISIPITLVATLGTAARNGVLIKGGMYAEELSKVKVVALDKTGTLTSGQPKVTDVVAFNGADKDRILKLAAGIESGSEHPLAQAVVAYGKENEITPAPITGFQSLTGAGAKATIDGLTWYIGSPGLFEHQLGVSLDEYKARISRLQEDGKTVVLVGREQSVLGLIAIRDTIRPKAKTVIHELHEAGIEKVVMLTGDNERTARAIAGELGIEEVFAGLKPEDKSNIIRELSERYEHIIMVGDGVNDAPALAEATVGVAMGAAGTDVALETADVVLMADDLEKLVYALKLAKRNQKVINQNLALSVVVIAGLIIGAVTGYFTLPIAVIGHEVSEFMVIGNGLRMLRS
ncbi:MAG: cadmium-translocating P-type ATPase [Gracilimonas sp.]|uniref:heavy metal translocating P-type ATPase n=1 Tax=Gracilimonas TaxID=649462 RepID=UPI001B2444BE|nr:cation-translocating P-type ATPase [Gracilimonas sp.]MBO6585594.1 cadmium-translocating P-type ATPase [Gracilimonas sp.]MBO6616591.1 cadmium-translocating P-type ATPase [Gracilimonas sp.]